MVGVLAAIALFGFSLPVATPRPHRDVEIERECRQVYRRTHRDLVCSEALGAWLPTFLEFGPEPSGMNRVTRGVPADVFVFSADGKRRTPPFGATFFSFSSALPKGSIIYDPAHHLVLYSQSCCAHGEQVLSHTTSPPPVHVRAADLRVVHTKAGITIGSRAADVIKRYGPATAYPVSGHPGLSVLSYTSRRSANDERHPCGSDQSFVLKDGRVIGIQLSGAC